VAVRNTNEFESVSLWREKITAKLRRISEQPVEIEVRFSCHNLGKRKTNNNTMNCMDTNCSDT